METYTIPRAGAGRAFLAGPFSRCSGALAATRLRLLALPFLAVVVVPLGALLLGRAGIVSRSRCLRALIGVILRPGTFSDVVLGAGILRILSRLLVVVPLTVGRHCDKA